MTLHSTSSHLSMPVIGMGTAVDRRNHDPAAIKEAILEAVKAGYRHFDTAGLYKSEPYLGEALAEAMRTGLVSRDELFVTTKLWSASAHPGLVIPALKNSLQYTFYFLLVFSFFFFYLLEVFKFYYIELNRNLLSYSYDLGLPIVKDIRTNYSHLITP